MQFSDYEEITEILVSSNTPSVSVGDYIDQRARVYIAELKIGNLYEIVVIFYFIDSNRLLTYRSGKLSSTEYYISAKHKMFDFVENMGFIINRIYPSNGANVEKKIMRDFRVSLAYLNTKKWFRTLKVIYVFYCVFSYFIALLLVFLVDQGTESQGGSWIIPLTFGLGWFISQLPKWIFYYIVFGKITPVKKESRT